MHLKKEWRDQAISVGLRSRYILVPTSLSRRCQIIIFSLLKLNCGTYNVRILGRLYLHCHNFHLCFLVCRYYYDGNIRLRRNFIRLKTEKYHIFSYSSVESKLNIIICICIFIEMLDTNLHIHNISKEGDIMGWNLLETK
jgi:hypothetical protein